MQNCRIAVTYSRTVSGRMRKSISSVLFLLFLIGLSQSKSKRKRNKEFNRGLLGEVVTQTDVNNILNMAANSPNLKNLIDRVLARGTNNNVIDFKKLNTYRLFYQHP